MGCVAQGYYTRDSKWAPWQEDEDAVRAYQHRVQHNEVAGERGWLGWLTQYASWLTGPDVLGVIAYLHMRSPCQ